MTDARGLAGESNSRADNGPDLRLVIEDEGLTSRFGRPLPEIEALELRLAVLRRHAAERGQRFDLLTDGDTGRGQSRSARDRVMALCGREATQERFLEQDIPAYLLTDRDERDYRHLAVTEADRVIAEALRMPVPRPMSGAVRTGSLLAAPVSEPTAVRKLGKACLSCDARADWLVLTQTMVAYVEREDAAAVMRSAGGRLLQADLHLDQVTVSSEGLRVCERLLVENTLGGGGLQPVAEPLPWSACRRAVFGAERCPAADRTAGPAVVLHENRGLRVLALPYAGAHTERIIAVVDQASDPPDGLLEGLRAAGVPAALLWVSGHDADPVLLPRFLWDHELHNLAVVASTEALEAPVPMWTRRVELRSGETTRGNDLVYQLTAVYPF